MQVQISIFVMSIIIALLFGYLLGRFWQSGMNILRGRMKKFVVDVRNFLVEYWYTIVFVFVTMYIGTNFDECVNLYFTEKFNGKNLIFLFWLGLIVLPMFESFEGFGISIKKRKQAKKEEFFTSEYLDGINKAQQQKGDDDE